MKDVRWLVLLYLPYSKGNCYSLLNIEYILIFATVRCFLFLLRIPMKVIDINVTEAIHQTLSHPAKGRIIQISVIRNKGQNTVSSPFDSPLCKSNKLNVIIL